MNNCRDALALLNDYEQRNILPRPSYHEEYDRVLNLKTVTCKIQVGEIIYYGKGKALTTQEAKLKAAHDICTKLNLDHFITRPLRPYRITPECQEWKFLIDSLKTEGHSRPNIVTDGAGRFKIQLFEYNFETAITSLKCACIQAYAYVKERQIGFCQTLRSSQTYSRQSSGSSSPEDIFDRLTFRGRAPRANNLIDLNGEPSIPTRGRDSGLWALNKLPLQERDHEYRLFK